MGDQVTHESTGDIQTGANKALLGDTFDFLLAKKITPLPLHEVELKQAQYRRHGNAAYNMSLHEFVAQMGITFVDTVDPESHSSCLEYPAGLREYCGDSDDEAYKKYQLKMAEFAECDGWLRSNHFIEQNVYENYVRLKQFEDEALSLVDPDDRDSIFALEERVFSELRSETHSEYLRRFREEHGSRRLQKLLDFERRRRTSESSSVLVAGDFHADTETCEFLQRQVKGKSYRDIFFNKCREQKRLRNNE